jgi:hypothetical protein
MKKAFLLLTTLCLGLGLLEPAQAFISEFNTDPIPKPIAMILLCISLIALIYSKPFNR